MKSTPPPDKGRKPDVGPWAGAGAGLLIVLCCAAPALIATGVAAGTLGAIGAWLANPLVIGVAIALGVVTAVGVTRRVGRRWRHVRSEPGCCPPVPPMSSGRPEDPPQVGETTS
jgi:hypothetical protein